MKLWVLVYGYEDVCGVTAKPEVAEAWRKIDPSYRYAFECELEKIVSGPWRDSKPWYPEGITP